MLQSVSSMPSVCELINGGIKTMIPQYGYVINIHDRYKIQALNDLKSVEPKQIGQTIRETILQTRNLSLVILIWCQIMELNIIL